MAVEVSKLARGEFSAGTPRELFTALRGLGLHNFDVARNGRFMVITEGLDAEISPITVLLNWRLPR